MRPIEKLFAGFFFAAVFAFGFVVWMYFHHFAPHSYGLSARQEDWAAFGEYVGGTLGGVFGLFAFIGVLITIVLLREQLDFLRQQSTRDELQRLMGAIVSKIDDILVIMPSHVPHTLATRLQRKGVTSITVGHLIQGGGTAAICPRDDYIVAASSDDLLNAVKPMLSLDAENLGIEFDSLAQTMEAYLGAGGSAEVEGIFNRRVQKYAMWLDAMGFSLSDRVKQHFQLQIVRSAHKEL